MHILSDSRPLLKQTGDRENTYANFLEDLHQLGGKWIQLPRPDTFVLLCLTLFLGRSVSIWWEMDTTAQT